jgi:hypothetical protein
MPKAADIAHVVGLADDFPELREAIDARHVRD